MSAASASGAQPAPAAAEPAIAQPANRVDDKTKTKRPAPTDYPTTGTTATAVGTAAAGTTPPAIPNPLDPIAVEQDRPVGLDEYRVLMGISIDKHAAEPARVQAPHVLPNWVHKIFDSSGSDTSIYCTILREEHTSQQVYIAYDWAVYGAMFAQLVISAVLIILGALNNNFHITIAILGAVNGIITGVLSLIKGQGYPVRLVEYMNNLRKVRENIDFMERELMVEARTVTLRQVMQLRSDYEAVRDDELKNNPNVWSASGSLQSAAAKARAGGTPAESQKSGLPV